MSTCFGLVPVTMNPPMPTLSPACTCIRVERLTAFDCGVGIGVSLGVGVAFGVAVTRGVADAVGAGVSTGVVVTTGVAVALEAGVAVGGTVGIGVGVGVAEEPVTIAQAENSDVSPVDRRVAVTVTTASGDTVAVRRLRMSHALRYPLLPWSNRDRRRLRHSRTDHKMD